MGMLLGSLWRKLDNLLDLGAMFVVIGLLQSVPICQLIRCLALKAMLHLIVQSNYLILFLSDLWGEVCLPLFKPELLSDGENEIIKL